MTPSPSRPPVTIVVGRTRAASRPTRPADRIIEALWAKSTAPSQAGLTSRTRTSSGRNRTLTAPRPNIAMPEGRQGDPQGARAGDDPKAFDERGAHPGIGDVAGIGRGAGPAVDAVDDEHRDEERPGIEDERRPRLAEHADDESGQPGADDAGDDPRGLGDGVGRQQPLGRDDARDERAAGGREEGPDRGLDERQHQQDRQHVGSSRRRRSRGRRRPAGCPTRA